MKFIRKVYDLKYYEVLSIIQQYSKYRFTLYKFDGEYVTSTLSDILTTVKDCRVGDRFTVTYASSDDIKIEIESEI